MVGLDTIFFHMPIIANFDNQSVILWINRYFIERRY